MALVIEDGSGITGANSYATVAEAQAFATVRGLSLPAADSDVEKALILAADKLETYEYKGERAIADQPLLWPRSGVYIHSGDTEFSSTAIPDALKNAQCQFAFDSTLTDLQPTGTGQEIIRRKVDVIETEFAKRGSSTITPQFNKAEGFLAPLLRYGGGLGVSTVRL